MTKMIIIAILCAAAAGLIFYAVQLLLTTYEKKYRIIEREEMSQKIAKSIEEGEEPDAAHLKHKYMPWYERFSGDLKVGTITASQGDIVRFTLIDGDKKKEVLNLNAEMHPKGIMEEKVISGTLVGVSFSDKRIYDGFGDYFAVITNKGEMVSAPVKYINPDTFIRF